MKKVMIFRHTMEECEMRRRERMLFPSECILISDSTDLCKIKGYWKDVMIDETIQLDGITKNGFHKLYCEA